MIVLDAWRRYGQPCIVVRFGNVLGSSGSVVPSFKRQIESRGPVTITHPEMKRFFMTIPEAVHLVLQAGMVGSGGELLVLDMGEPIKVVDLAQDLIKLSGYEVDEIPIVYTGVRPGEKLEERLWEDGATVTRTANSQILRVSEPEGLTSDALDVTLADLNAAAQASDPRAISTIFGRCLPSYAPSPIGPADAALRVVTQEI
jgi:FlaA1/EpsC-like NDP-sugar epimerase